MSDIEIYRQPPKKFIATLRCIHDPEVWRKALKSLALLFS
jgi:hypothetical protein